MTIPNPYYSPAHHDEAGNPRTVPAIVNLKESAVTMLASRGRIDAAQLAAATRFRALWEAMCRSTRAIDYSREPVDGAGRADPIGHRQMHAAQELRRIRPLLSEKGYWLVSRICGEGYSLGEVVGSGASKRSKLKAARDLRELLDLLCEFWNLSARR